MLDLCGPLQVHIITHDAFEGLCPSIFLIRFFNRMLHPFIFLIRFSDQIKPLFSVYKLAF